MKRCPSTQKDRYPTPLEGQLALAGIQGKQSKHRKQRFRETPTRVYPCGSCQGFHLTSK